MRRLFNIFVLLAVASAANAVPLILISHEVTEGQVTLTSITDGGHTSGIAPPSTAIWEWDGATLSSTGLYSRVISISSGINGTPVFADQVTDLSIDTATGSATATAYSCIEGIFGESVGSDTCGQYLFGPNFLDDSTTTWGPGLAVNQTIGGDDVSTGGPRSISKYNFGTVSITGTGMNPGDLVMIGNGIPLGTPGAELVTFEVYLVAGPPANDDFSNRISLLSGSTAASGANVSASGEAGEPNHAGLSVPLASVWWSWEAPFNGQLTVSTAGSAFNTTLASYVGNSVDTLTEVAANDDFVGLTSQVTFDVSAGVAYAIAIDGYGSSEGAINLQVDFEVDDPHWALVKILENPSPNDGDFFGDAISMAGDRILIGANGDNDFAGRAYLFDAVTGSLVHTFDNPSPTVDDFFGLTVSVAGDHILIGAPGNDTNGLESGRAYLFDAVTGGLVHTFEDASPNSFDYFGAAVSVAGDRILIGAYGDNNVTGRAYLFDAVTGSLVHTFDNPPPTSSVFFGREVSVAGDQILIGAVGDNTTGLKSGRGYLFDAVTGNLLHTFENPSPGDFDSFGGAVSMAGDHILIGAAGDDTTGDGSGRAYLFDAMTGNLVGTFDNPSPTVNASFGEAVSVISDHILIGANGDDTTGDGSGRAYLFDAVSGSLVHTFENPSPGDFDSFGGAASVAGDHILIAAPRDDTTGNASGRAYLYAPEDADGDGIADSVETITADTDGDGTPDYLDLDSDANGIPDADEVGSNPVNPADGDGNSVPDFQDFDNDGDGVLDTVEIGPDPNNPLDWDLDGIPDYVDVDSQAGIGGDTQPDPPGDFGTATDVALSTFVKAAGSVSVSGINEPVQISIVGGQYSRNCDSFWHTAAGLVIDGDTICVRQSSAATYSTAQNTVLSFGSPAVTSTFSTVTRPDTNPDTFSFNGLTNVTQDELYTSNVVTITGLGVPAPISVVGGEYSIGCTATFTADPGTITNGETVCVRHVNAGATTTVLIVGTGLEAFSTTTGTTIDTTPDANELYFIDVTLVCGIPPDENLEYPPGYECPEALNFEYRTPERTISDINVPVPISVSAGSVYSIGCYDDGLFDYTDQPGLVSNGQTVCVTHVTPSEKPYDIPVTLSVGDLDVTFNIFAEVNWNFADTTPNPFNFPSATNVPLSSLVISQEVTVKGLDNPLQISIPPGAGEYSIGCTSSFTTDTGSIENGESVCVRHISASMPGVQTYSELKIGKGKGYFYATTEQDSDGDGIPDSVELANGLNPQLPSDALDDADGDLRSNLDEYLDGGQITVADTGDVNADQTVSVADLLLMQKHLMELTVLDTQAISRGDYNRNDALDLNDLLSLQKLLTGQ